MENDKIILGGGNIQGNITSCKIENQIIRIDKKSAFSPIQYTTYASYDVCSRQVIERYVVPETNDFFGFILIVGIASLLIILGIIVRRD